MRDPLGYCYRYHQDVRENDSMTYERIELTRFYLSHIAYLSLIQGSSIHQLFTDASVEGAQVPFFPVFVSPVQWFTSPPTIPKLVLVHIHEKDNALTQAQATMKLFMMELNTWR